MPSSCQHYAVIMPAICRHLATLCRQYAGNMPSYCHIMPSSCRQYAVIMPRPRSHHHMLAPRAHTSAPRTWCASTRAADRGLAGTSPVPFLAVSEAAGVASRASYRLPVPPPDSNGAVLALHAPKRALPVAVGSLPRRARNWKSGRRCQQRAWGGCFRPSPSSDAAPLTAMSPPPPSPARSTHYFLVSQLRYMIRFGA